MPPISRWAANKFVFLTDAGYGNLFGSISLRQGMAKKSFSFVA
jgi:hypothetical protein